jgi:hypothetical protein
MKDDMNKAESRAYEMIEESSEPILDITSINRRYERLKLRNTNRDIAMTRIKSVREGRIHDLAPEIFAVDGAWKEPIIANMIDIAAHDISDMLAPLPTISCLSSTMITESKRTKATKRTQIAASYISSSKLGLNVRKAVDWYISYGFVAARVEPNYEKGQPTIRFINPIGCYYEKNRNGDVIAFYQRATVDRQDLATKYPEIANKVLKKQGYSFKATADTSTIDVIFYHDKDWDIAFVAGDDSYIIDKQPNYCDDFTIRIAERPGGTDIPRGQFDDIIFLQLAQAEFALLQLKAAYESVNAPLAMPDDVMEFAVGEGSIIKSKTPQNIRRVGLEIPQSVLLEGQSLQQQLQLGSRMPQTRTGNTNASVITGQGVKALEGGYEAQLASHQAVFANLIQEVIALAFKVDVSIFGDMEKTLSGTENGTPFEITYNAAKDIGEDHSVSVRYGVMAGLDPNRALIYALQGLSVGLFSVDFVRRELPFAMDIEDEKRKVLLEKMDEAAIQALLNYSASIPQMAAQGQDPSQAVKAFAQAAEDIRKGKSMSESLQKIFAPEPPKPTEEELAAAQMQQAMSGMALGGAQMPQEGAMVAPEGQGMPMAPQAPQGPPDIATLFASMGSNGQPNMSARVTRNQAI